MKFLIIGFLFLNGLCFLSTDIVADENEHKKPSFKLESGKVEYSRGSLDVDLITTIVAEKQKELRDEFILTYVRDNLEFGSYATYSFIDNILNTLLTESNKKLMAKRVGMEVAKYSIILELKKRIEKNLPPSLNIIVLDSIDSTKVSHPTVYKKMEKVGSKSVKNDGFYSDLLMDLIHYKVQKKFIKKFKENGEFIYEIFKGEIDTTRNLYLENKDKGLAIIDSLEEYVDKFVNGLANNTLLEVVERIEKLGFEFKNQS